MSIIKLLKTSLYIGAACCLMGIGGVVFMNKAGIAQTLDNWRLIPRPQNLTELYFTDYHKLADSLKSGASQHVVFTVHNLEHRLTTYNFKLVALSENGSVQKALGDGTFSLAQDASKQTDVAIAIPPLDDRINIKLSLEYMGTVLGDDAPSLQAQSIHFWVKIPDYATAIKENHGRT